MTVPKKSRKSTNGSRTTKGRPAPKPARKSRRNATKEGAGPAVRPGTKQAALIALLERPKGASIAQLRAKTNWQAHSVRAGLTGLRKRGFGIARGENAARVTIYRIVPQSKGSPS